VQLPTEPPLHLSRTNWSPTQREAQYRHGVKYLTSGQALYPVIPSFHCGSLLEAEGPSHQKLMALIASSCLSRGSHNIRTQNVHSQLLFNLSAWNLKRSTPTKVVKQILIEIFLIFICGWQSLDSNSGFPATLHTRSSSSCNNTT